MPFFYQAAYETNNTDLNNLNNQTCPTGIGDLTDLTVDLKYLFS